MQQFFLVLLVITGSAFIIQTILSFAGLDADADIPDSAPGEAFGPFGFLSIRNVITFLLGFSAAGFILMRAGVMLPIVVVLSLLFGLILAGSIVVGMRLLLKLEQKNEIFPHEYRGIYATVMVRIPPGRTAQGKVEFTLKDRQDEMVAVTDEEETLNRGEQVQIVRLLDNGCLLVQKIIVN
jgi:membrane-bound ClpP family serine protease